MPEISEGELIVLRQKAAEFDKMQGDYHRCVFCDMHMKPTECTDGWYHLMDDGRAVPCTKPAQ